MPHQNIPNIRTTQTIKRSIHPTTTRCTLRTSTMETNKLSQAWYKMSTIMDTTRQCRKIFIQVPRMNFSVNCAMNRVWLLKSTNNSFITIIKVSVRSTRNDGDQRKRNSTHRRKSRKNIRLLKNILIISTSQVLCQRLHRHLLQTITV